MLLHVASDLHADFCKGKILDPVPADILVLAGDVSEIGSLDWQQLAALCKHYKDVIWVPGNHEYYDQRVDAATRMMETHLPSNLHVATGPKYETIQGQRFLLGTMWFDPKLDHWDLRRFINDFTCIKGFLPWAHNEYYKFCELLKELRGSDIVVSHHLPSDKSGHPRWKDAKTNCYFVADQEGIIIERQPKLWIHGHTHSSFDYNIGATRIVCNPRGYHDENSKEFNPRLVIDPNRRGPAGLMGLCGLTLGD